MVTLVLKINQEKTICPHFMYGKREDLRGKEIAPKMHC
jgi:hypothetical protein